MKTLRWNSRDLEAMPEDGKRYEIVDGELYVSKQPHWQHQFVCGRVHLTSSGSAGHEWRQPFKKMANCIWLLNW